MKIAVIIPAYNAAATIGAVIEGVKRWVPADTILVIDDGSSDNTVQIARATGVHVFLQSVNQGKGAALKKGFVHALERGSDWILTLDADGQHAPEIIPDFLALMTANVDLVIGSRMRTLQSMPLHRLLSNRITSGMIGLRIGCRIQDSQCGFRLLRAEMLRRLVLKTRHFDLESEIILKTGLRGYQICSIPVPTIYNQQSTSIRLVIDTLRFLKLYLKSYCWT
jgi:glycosyltransferase involved in cell wall biosynthesis